MGGPRKQQQRPSVSLLYMSKSQAQPFSEPEPEVFITLSARVLKGGKHGLAERRVQLNWFNIELGNDPTQNHTLYLLRRPAGLFRIDEDAVYKKDLGSSPEGQITTHLSFPRSVFP